MRKGLEELLVSRILNYPDEYPKLMGFKLNSFMFDAEIENILNFIKSHFERYGKVPDCLTVKQIYSDFEVVKANEPVSFYCEEIMKRISYSKLTSVVDRLQQLDEQDDDFTNVNVMVGELESTVQDIRTFQGLVEDADYVKSANDRKDKYKERKMKKGMIGAKTWWNKLNELTGGIQEGWLVTLFGLAKEGKTWLGLLMLKAFEEQGFSCGIFSNEMGAKEIEMRLDALNFKLPYMELKRATLSTDNEKKYFRGLNKMKMFPKKNGIKIFGGGSASYIYAKIKQYGLKYWLVDGAYLCEDERGAGDRTNKMYNLTQDIKSVSNRTNTCGIITLQLQPDEAQKLHNKGNPMGIFGSQWSRSASQDSDLIIELVCNEKLRNDKMMGIHIVGQRDGETGSFMCSWDFDKMEFLELKNGGGYNKNFENENISKKLNNKFGGEKRKITKFKIGTKAT